VEEADETVYWLELLVDNNIVQPHRMEGLLAEARELTAIFTSARRTSRHQITN
jgi:four helix bundle protein